MARNRAALKIQCQQCPVAEYCIVHSLNMLEIKKVNDIITKIYFLKSGEHLYFQSEKIQYIFAIYTGSCKEYAVDKEGDEKINSFYFPGDLIGIESMSLDKYVFSVMALEETQLCAIPLPAFYQLMRDYPAIMNRFIYLISGRLLKNKHIPITTNAKRRIAAFLLDMLYRLQTSDADSQEHVYLSMSQLDIGNLLGLAHETVSRTLGSFQYEKIIKIHNKEIYITDIDSLKSIANCGEFFEHP